MSRGNLGSVLCNEVWGDKKLPKALICTKQSRQHTVHQLVTKMRVLYVKNDHTVLVLSQLLSEIFC